jgi:hypothetical protein
LHKAYTVAQSKEEGQTTNIILNNAKDLLPIISNHSLKLLSTKEESKPMNISNLKRSNAFKGKNDIRGRQ